MKLIRLKKLFFLHLQHLPMPSKGWRSAVCKMGSEYFRPQTYIYRGRCDI